MVSRNSSSIVVFIWQIHLQLNNNEKIYTQGLVCLVHSIEANQADLSPMLGDSESIGQL